MKFSDLKECPFCGCTEYYTINYMQGRCEYNYRFDGKEAHNEQMYDGLTVTQGARVKCRDCDRVLGNLLTDKVINRVEEALKGGKR